MMEEEDRIAEAVRIAQEKERAAALKEQEALRAELMASFASSETDQTQREVFAAVTKEREASEKLKTEALKKQKEEYDARRKRELDAQSASETSSLEKALGDEKKRSQTQKETALKEIQQKIATVEAEIKTIEDNYKERLAKGTADSEVRLRAENQVRVDLIKRPLEAAALKAEAERDETQAMFVKENKKRKEIHNKLLDIQGNVRVFVRSRPINGEVVCEYPSEEELLLRDGASKLKYEFDHVFPPGTSQQALFEVIQPTCQSVLDGYNVCLFAYGQSGSGKTYTMDGLGAGPQKGLVGRAYRELFDLMAGMTQEMQFQVKFSMAEIYNDTIRDLLTETDTNVKLEPAQTNVGTVVPGLTQITVTTPEEVIRNMNIGRQHRQAWSNDESKAKIRLKSLMTRASVAAMKPNEDEPTNKPDLSNVVRRASLFGGFGITGMLGSLFGVAPRSSSNPSTPVISRGVSQRDMKNHSITRSHCVMTVTVIGSNLNDRSAPLSIGKLHMVDLACSEKVDTAGATADVIEEIKNVRKSLDTVGDVINALAYKNLKNVPFKNSKLTTMLQDSLSGKSKVVVLTHINPATVNTQESISSLNFATRCKNTSLSGGTAPEPRSSASSKSLAPNTSSPKIKK